MANPITQIILTAVDKTKAAFASAKAGLGSLGTAASALKGTLGSIFVGLSVAGFVGKVKQAVDAMDEAGKSAKAAGTSVKNFTGLEFAGEQSGVEDMQRSLVALVASLNAAKNGTGPAAEAFKALKIDPTQFSDSSDALDVLADRFSRMPDGINKTALAIDIFGKRVGPQMIPLLNQGSEGIRRLKDEAAALGKVIGDDAAAAAEQFNDNLDKLKTASQGIGIKLANEVLPGLNQITAAMVEASKEGNALKTLWVGLGGLGAAIFTDDFLTNTQKLEKAQRQLNDAIDGGFEEESDWVRELRTSILVLENKVAAEEKAAAAEKAAADQKERYTAITKVQNEELQKATDERIDDAKRLQTALQSAFSASIKAEEDYLRQAKRLRAEANGMGEVGDDPESQARARLDAIAAAMKLQRTASSESLESVQEQADATRDLAANLTDAALKADLLKQANLAEAAALERAAAAERERVQGLAAQMQETQRQADNMKAALEGIGKEVSVEIKPGTQMQQTIDALKEVAHLIDVIKAKGPVVPMGGLDTNKLTGGIADLQTAALQYGRR